jgi:nitroreductase
MFLLQAPVVIAVCANQKRITPYGTRGRDLYCIQDASAAVEHILLCAVDNGLDACWVGAFDERIVSKILQIPPEIIPIALIPMGYSTKKRQAPKRKDIKELIHRNHW